MMQLIDAVEQPQIKPDAMNFSVGDTVKVHFTIVEGKSERVQIFEGLVLSVKGSGLRRTFRVRKISYNIGVERIFPLHSPRVQRVEVVRRGRVRRAKLFYIRDRVGKAAKVPELIVHRARKHKSGG